MKQVVTGLIFTALLLGCSQPANDFAAENNIATGEQAVTTVTAARIIDADPKNWLSHGRTYDEQRFSPLDEITTSNIDDLGLAWYFDIPTKRGMEATPIVVDGRMYVTGSWSVVYALNAETGEELWRYDPQVPKSWARYACCDVVNRGVAAWNDSVFVGTIDGWLVALDAATGEERWRTDTIDRQPPYTITGAPRVVNGLVIIGNGGADFGVRGYVTAYDATNGEQRWRFYTVPGNPDEGFASDIEEEAAKTWTGEWWTMGGGGTVWDSMAYDPELDLLYIGVGNGSPWNQKIRSPGGGDNLFLSSIVALRPATGEYVWHYQTTPGEAWDYTATQHIVLADLMIAGESRKVLMQAPKNGFYYVLDRENGKLISAEPYVPLNWASSVDKQTGRPIETENARYADGPFVIVPGPLGGHNWHPMAYSPNSNLVYIPTQDVPFVHVDDPNFDFDTEHWNTGTDFLISAAPDDPEQFAALMNSIRGQLIAWNPVAQKEVWRYQHAGPWNGGVLATGGDLVFQGSLIGEFAAYDANSGERLWQFDGQSGIAAAPVSYSVGGNQHVAVAAGWGSIFAMRGGDATASMGMKNISRILAFRLGASESLPPRAPQVAVEVPLPPENEADAPKIAAGKAVYSNRCSMCHGDGAASGGITPDLRFASAETHAIWDGIVIGGALQDKGMPGFPGILTAEDADAVHAYVIDRAWRAYQRQEAQR